MSHSFRQLFAESDGRVLILDACSKAYLLIFAFAALLLLMPLAVIIHRGSADPGIVKVTVSMAAIACFLIIVLKAFKITLTDEEIIYRSFFLGTRSIRLCDIKEYTILAGEYSVLDGTLPSAHLGIMPFSSEVKPICISLKVFDEKEMARVIAVLDEHIEENNKTQPDEGKHTP
ncbi:MAG: hypothetical protein PHW04_09250 [Candidatus Wallbacteria bacterium]|nr:hypothetical protein [Candidatus Wallbacteria bacterium]